MSNYEIISIVTEINKYDIKVSELYGINKIHKIFISNLNTFYKFINNKNIYIPKITLGNDCVIESDQQTKDINANLQANLKGPVKH